jgi:hypothetical protein
MLHRPRAGVVASASLFVLFVAGYVVGRWQAADSVHAQSHLPPQVWNVPKSWGTFKAVYHDQLLFEDADGTIRSVYPNSSSVVFTIRRR